MVAGVRQELSVIEEPETEKWQNISRAMPIPMGERFISPRKGSALTNGRNKGAVYERELAKKFCEYGYDARRGIQFCGEPDVLGLPFVHVEAKRREKISIYEWMEQAVRDAGEKFPTVFFRKNCCETLVCMRLDDWMAIYGGYVAYKNMIERVTDDGK